MTDTINDIYFPEENSLESRTIDAREFFPRISLDVVSHNNSREFHDIRPGKGKVLNVTRKHVLVIKKPRKNILDDIYSEKKYATNILSIFSKHRVIRTNPISIIKPLSKTRFNTLDIRSYETIVSTRVYSDIYYTPTPLSRRARKVLRKHRRRIVIGSVVFASLSVSLVLLSLAAKNYVERETIRSYNRISALKDMRGIEAIAREVRDIRDSFETTALIFSPFRAGLDNRFYSHPQVHLASNVIHG